MDRPTARRLVHTSCALAPGLAAEQHDYTQASKGSGAFLTPPKTNTGTTFPIKTVGIIGGGVMGGGIAQMTALGGYDVVVCDISAEACELARDEMVDSKWGMKRSVEKGKITYEQCEAAIPRLTTTTDQADLADCDLIIEAVPEKLGLKQDVFASLDKICKPSCIFTSNTSGFVIAEIAEKCSDARKKLFAGMHYSNPVPVMRMLEIIYTEETSQDCIDACYQLGEAQDKAISLVRDVPGTYGFILNRVFAAAAREARQLVDEGIAQGC